MSLSRDELDKISRLAKLNLSDEEIDELTETLSGIIDFFHQLGEVDTNDIAPMAHPLAMAQRLRADEITTSDEREKHQKSTPHVARDYYLVPKVIE